MERNRRRWRIGILSSIIFVLSLLPATKSPAQVAFEGSTEFRIARRYLQQAQVLYGEGRYESAAELLEVSLEFAPDYIQEEAQKIEGRLTMDWLVDMKGQNVEVRSMFASDCILSFADTVSSE